MKPGWRNLVVLLAALFLSATGARAVENRFLVVVEATADSSKNVQATRDAIADLLIKGFNGIAKTGDSVGLWVVGEKLDSSFPLFVWQPSAVGSYAVQADGFIAKRPWVGRWNAGALLPSLKAVSTNSEALTVILITAPTSRLPDLPFSERISEIQDKAAPDLERTKLPFVTFVTIRERDFVSAAVNSGVGPWTIANPPLPKRVVVAEPAPAPKPVVATKSMVGSGTKIELQATPPPKFPEPKPAADPLPQVLAPIPAPQPTATAARETPPPTVAPPAPVQAATVEMKPAETAPKPTPEPQKSIQASEPAPIPPAPIAAKVEASPAPPSSPSVQQATAEIPAPVAHQQPQPVANPTAVTPPTSVASVATAQPSGSGFLMAGIASLLGIAALGWIAMRRPKPAQRSLITESYRSK